MKANITEEQLNKMISESIKRTLNEMSLYTRDENDPDKLNQVNPYRKENPDTIDPEKVSNGGYEWAYNGRTNPLETGEEDPIDLIIWRLKKNLPDRGDGFPKAIGVRRWIYDMQRRYNVHTDKMLRDDYTLPELYDILYDIRCNPNHRQG